MTSKATIHEGDALAVLKTLPAGSWRCCVTSPPYWGLRDYGVEGQYGLEESPEAWCDRMVAVFEEVKRVLADDGTLWLNLGDGYASSPQKEGSDRDPKNPGKGNRRMRTDAYKAKDLIGQPWMVAFALRAAGWYLRADIIWHKPNPMPESVRDRPTKAHEYLFLLTKSPRYYYDAAAIKEAQAYPECSTPEDLARAANRRRKAAPGNRQGNYRVPDGWETGKGSHGTIKKRDKQAGHGRRHAGFNERWKAQKRGTPPRHAQYDSSTRDSLDEVGRGGLRNKRSVWTVATEPFPEAHFATFPMRLILPCILAGSEEGDTVGDPFNGSGTTGAACKCLGRDYVGIELNPEYAAMARRRIKATHPGTGRATPAAKGEAGLF